MTNQTFKLHQNELQTNIQHELSQPFIILCTTIITVWRKFMTDNKIEELINAAWGEFVEQYTPRSSTGYIIIGKRKTDPDGSFFFCERTFGKPEERINEWGDRMMHRSMDCSDTIFGEKFSHRLLGHIRIQRLRINKNTNEVEWFNMNGLKWDDITFVLQHICTFVSTIKRTRPVKPININAATLVKIKRLPLVGDKLANNIVAARSNRHFADLNDLKRRVNKIGDRIANAFKEFITFGFGEGDENNENQLINVNTDPEKTLKELPKIGTIIAKNIIEHRKTTPIIIKTDLLKIPGIGPKTYEAIKDKITV